jgi:hypothetical protein
VRRHAVLLVLLSAACATTGADGEGDRDLPTSGVGPFRKLSNAEVRGIAPFVLDDRLSFYRDPYALVEEDGSITLYAVARRGTDDVIVKTRATDGRTFYGTSGHAGKQPTTVLAPNPFFEGSSLRGPCVLRRGDDLFLFYGSAGGIHAAISRDGGPFTRFANEPLLARDASVAAWETDQVRSPGAYLLPNGRVRLFYTSGSAIGEAESDDGVRNFKRLSREPVLRAQPRPSVLLPNEKPPFDERAVGDPFVLVRTTPAGRKHVRVLYTGIDLNGNSTIGFAARYGDDGSLVRQQLPVYSERKGESAPAFVEAQLGSFLYTEQDRPDGRDRSYRAIAGAFAPGNITLPEPADYPESL